MMHLRRLFPARLASDIRGATLPEFAIILPTFLMLLFGIFDIGQGIYVQSVMQGAMQDAGRDAGLEDASSQIASIDQYVKDQMGPVAITNPTYKVTRQNYYTFSDVGRPEDFTDKNNNNSYDPGECFTDENGSNEWEADVSKDGLGGANDIVMFTIDVSYDRIFPLWKLIGQSQRAEVSTSTILRNQPFASQTKRTTKYICPAA